MNQTLSEIRDDIIVFLDTPHTQKDVSETLGLDHDITLAVMLDLAKQGRIMIAPGTNAQKWVTSAQAKKILRMMDGEDE